MTTPQSISGSTLQGLALASGLLLAACSGHGTNGFFDGDGGAEGAAPSGESARGGRGTNAGTGGIGGGLPPLVLDAGTEATPTPKTDAGSTSPSSSPSSCTLKQPISTNATCEACIEKNCCAKVNQCLASQECVALDTCLSPCASLDQSQMTACVQPCVQNNSAAVPTWQAASDCLSTSCAAACSN